MRRPSLIIALAVAVVGIGAYLLLLPTWKTATEAEIRSVADPALLAAVPSETTTKTRYQRLLATIKDIRPAPPTRAEFTDVLRHDNRQGFLIQEGARLGQLAAILNEGPFEAPYPQADSERTAIRELVKGLGGEGTYLIRFGNPSAGLDLLLLALKLARRQAEGMASSDEPVADISLVSDAYEPIGISLSYLPESELSRVEAALPKEGEDNSDYQRALRLHFQRQLIPLLADPVKWAQTQPSPDEALVEVASSPDRGPGRVVIVGYDALATGRLANRLFAALYAGAALPPKRRLQDGPSLLSELMRSLPSPGDNLNAPGDAPFVAWERLETQRVPNAFGKQLLIGQYAKLADSLKLVDVRQHHVILLRTHIAVHRYRLRQGVPPRSLEELVSAGYLPSVPQDVFGTGPLPYAPTPFLYTGPQGVNRGDRTSFGSP